MDIYKLLVRDGGGACSPEKFMYVYENFIKNKNVKVIVEIGVYNGCFLLPITVLNNNVLSYGIDPYKPYLQTDIENNKKLFELAKSMSMNAKFLENVYNRLIANITEHKINVKIIRDTAENAIINFEDDTIDILHIDGNHDYSSVLKDLQLYSKKIINNGIIVMDDINWQGVKKALNEFLLVNNNFKIIVAINPTWCIIQKS